MDPEQLFYERHVQTLGQVGPGKLGLEQTGPSPVRPEPTQPEVDFSY